MTKGVSNYKKNKLWFDKLPSDKKRLIDEYVERLVNLGNNTYLDIFDKCIAIALHDSLGEDADVDSILSINNEYIKDYNSFIQNKGRGGFDMLNDKVVKENIEQRILTLIKGRVVKSKGLLMLKKEFGLPAAELSNMWIQCKVAYGNSDGQIKKSKVGDITKTPIINELTEVKVIDQTNDKGDHVAKVVLNGEEVWRGVADKMVDDLPNIKSFTEGCIEPISNVMESTIDVKDIDKKNSADSKLVCRNVIKEIEGEYGVYKKDNMGVYDIKNDKMYSCACDVDLEAIRVMDYKNDQVNVLRAQLQAITETIENLEFNANKDISKLTELLEVFNM